MVQLLSHSIKYQIQGEHRNFVELFLDFLNLINIMNSQMKFKFNLKLKIKKCRKPMSYQYISL